MVTIDRIERRVKIEDLSQGQKEQRFEADDLQKVRLPKNGDKLME